MVVPSSRGGVPVFRRPRANPARSNDVDSPSAGASPTLPAGQFFSPRWISPRRNVPVVMTTAPAVSRAAVGQDHALDPAVDDGQIVGLALDDGEVGRLADRRLHGGRVELAVGLGARTADGRTLAAVEQAKLDAALVGDAAHEAVERIDLADEVALAKTADGGVAGHRADGRELVGQQRRARAHARGRGRGLTAGVAAANDDDVEGCLVHLRTCSAMGDLLTPDRQGSKLIRLTGCRICFT